MKINAHHEKFMLCIIYINKNKKKITWRNYIFSEILDIFIYLHTHTLIHKHTCIHILTHVHTLICKHILILIHTHTHGHMHTHAHMHKYFKTFFNKKESIKSKQAFIPRPCRKFLQTKKRTQTRFPVLAKIEAGPFPEGNLNGWQMCSTLSSHINSKLSHTDIATHWNSDSANTISTWNQELFQSREMASLDGSAVIFSKATWS